MIKRSYKRFFLIIMNILGNFQPYFRESYQISIGFDFQVSKMAINKGFTPLLYYSHSIVPQGLGVRS